MKQLEELEQKVLHIIQKHKDLQEKLNFLQDENKKLKEQNQHLELSLMEQSESAKSLVNEKAVIKNSIEELLESIGALENLSKESVK